MTNEEPRSSPFKYLFGPGPAGDRGALWPRWTFLRCLGLIFFSAFYSLAFQIKGLIGPDGILPAGAYLKDVTRVLPGLSRLYYVPTVLWLGSGRAALMALVWGGLIASVLLVLNVWPRVMNAVCLVLFLSFISAAQDFSSYQSDGMLLEAAFLCLFFAPRGLRPGLGADQPPSRASLFLLRWEWFRIYFESGIVKLLSGEEQWRNLTAMDHYYENGPLPTWLGWHVQQRLSHGFHAGTALFTLAVELGLVWLAWLPRPFRLACFAIVTPLQIGIILTANYAFLNYLVLVLGFLLLDDRIFARLRFRVPQSEVHPIPRWRMALSAVVLAWILYATAAPYLAAGARPLAAPARLLAPFRIANQYGLFAVMTRARYEIEFQGSRDGRTWIAYPFRYKPQDPREAPGIYAPYQPRFEWNLWFASLGSWNQYPWVLNAQVRLLESSPDVLALFRRDPFAGKPPRQVRAVLWQYWFTDPATKRRTGAWWRREERGLYASALERTAAGTIQMR
jgi:lipase maturation factor 1